MISLTLKRETTTGSVPAKRKNSALGFGIFLLLLFVAPSQVFAQHDMDPGLPGSSFEITGQIRASDGRRTAELVSVRLERGSGSLVDQQTTDSSGKFRFSRLGPGQYVVSARAPGFRVSPQSVDISRSLPRAHLLLQLVPEASPFASRENRPGVVDSKIPKEARHEMDKAHAALENKKSGEAILHLEKAVGIFPNFFEAQMLLATTYMNDGNLDKAEAAFRQALKVNPESVTAQVSLGDLHRRQKKYVEAEKILSQALQSEEDSWVGHYALARVFWETNETVKAGREIGRSIQLQPNFAEAHLLAGNVFVRLGMAENAIVEYEEYLRLAPTSHLASQTQQLVEKLKKSTNEKKP